MIHRNIDEHFCIREFLGEFCFLNQKNIGIRTDPLQIDLVCRYTATTEHFTLGSDLSCLRCLSHPGTVFTVHGGASSSCITVLIIAGTQSNCDNDNDQNRIGSILILVNRE